MARLRVEGTDLDLETREDETILATLYRAGYAHRVGCKRGGCAVCKVEITSGEVRYQATVSEQALPTTERKAGITLTCRAIPIDDVVIAVPPEGKLRCVAPMLTELAMKAAQNSPKVP